MPGWMIALIVAVDVVVTAVVLWWVFSRRRIAALAGMTFAEFQKFAQSTSTVVRDHMRANYSGNPSHLPAVLPDLLSKVDGRAREKGLNLTRETLKAALARMITSQGLAKPADVSRAMEMVV